MIPALLLGMLGGFGLWLIARGLHPAPARLVNALATLDQPRWATTEEQRPRRWLPSAILDAATASVSAQASQRTGLRRDLAVCERSVEAHAVDKLTTALLAFASPVGCWMIATLGGGALPAVPFAVAAVALGVAGWLYADVQLRQRAAARRLEFASSVSSYLELVSILLAGGSGVEQALRDAAHAGHGWSFLLLQRCITDAHLQNRSPWQTLGDTAESMALMPLVELAAAMTLAGESGARVRESLTAKAESLRAHELAAIETAAAASTEKMGGPVAFLVIGFVVLIGYPALATILQL